MKPRGLLGLTGLSISGGIASVNRTIVRVLDEEVRAGRLERVDRLLLLDEGPGAPPAAGDEWLAHGDQRKFALRLLWERWRKRPDWLFFDLVGIARSAQLPLPAPKAPSIVFCHGIELMRATPGTPHRRALTAATRLITNSETTAARMREDFPEVADRIRVALLCIDPAMIELWEAQQAALPPASELEAQRRAQPVVLIVSRVWAEERGKGHDELLDAWPQIRAAVPGAQLWVVGDGDDRARLEAKARERGIEEAVRFLGRVSDAELADCYRRASLFAMPSRQEGFGLVYAEAMWHGVPCLASRDDAGAEVVRDGETGALVRYGDVDAIGAAIRDLLGDPEKLRRLSDAASREARERFGYERFKRDLLVAMDLGDADPGDA